MAGAQLGLFDGQGPVVLLAGRRRVPVVVLSVIDHPAAAGTLHVTVEEVESGKRWAMNDHALRLWRL